MINISNEEYLKNILSTAKLILQELEIVHRIEIATYESKKEMLRNQINSIESQLQNT